MSRQTSPGTGRPYPARLDLVQLHLPRLIAEAVQQQLENVLRPAIDSRRSGRAADHNKRHVVFLRRTGRKILNPLTQ